MPPRRRIRKPAPPASNKNQRDREALPCPAHHVRKPSLPLPGNGSRKIRLGSAAHHFTAGGGVDVKLAAHISARGKIYYSHTQFSPAGQSNTQNDVTFEPAIVVHW